MPRRSPGPEGLFSREEPPARRFDIIANIDGGARGNPGPAGYGVSIRDSDGNLVAELSHYLGRQTNNVAEYSGLLAALEYAVQNGVKSLQVVSDSELLVKQMRGIYKVHSPELKLLHERARGMARKLENFDVRHVLRAQNKDADRLANLAMDQGAGGPAAAPAKSGIRNSLTRPSLNGIVKDGVVHLLGGELPEGTLVKVQVKEEA
jgi:ribonuclease HI